MRVIPSVAPYQVAQLTIRPGLSLERFPNLIYKDWVLALVNIESPIHITEIRRRITAAGGTQPAHDLDHWRSGRAER